MNHVDFFLLERPLIGFLLLPDVMTITHLFFKQISAASIFEIIPQPLGPTIPVKPSSIKKLVLSAKDLNPFS